jgi:hypothetical protein
LPHRYYLEVQEWRRAHSVDSLYTSLRFPEREEYVRRAYPHGFHGVTRGGVPVCVLCPGRYDAHVALHRLSSRERILQVRGQPRGSFVTH